MLVDGCSATVAEQPSASTGRDKKSTWSHRYGKPKGTILSNTIFLWTKLIIAWTKIFLHWQIHFHMGKTMFAWANSLLHGQLHYCIGKSIHALANLLLHWQIYYCTGKSIIAWANLLSIGNLFCMGKIILRTQRRTRSDPKLKCTDFMRIISLRLIIKCAPRINDIHDFLQVAVLS